MTPSPTSGYSGTPLAKKLGILAGGQVVLKGAPADYRALLNPLPTGVRFGSRVSATTDIVHVFATSRTQLATALGSLRTQIRADGVVWVSWPKKASKVPTDITEDTIREIALPMGYVDVKVCAVNEIWSGLKLVIRKALR